MSFADARPLEEAMRVAAITAIADRFRMGSFPERELVDEDDS
jgi:hypothetical protein